MTLQTTLSLAALALFTGWLFLLFTNSELAFKILYGIIAVVGRTIWFIVEAVAKAFGAIFAWIFGKKK